MVKNEKQLQAELDLCRGLLEDGIAQHENQTRVEMEERIATLQWVLDDE